MDKYRTTVTAVGEIAGEFAEGGILVFFGPAAPEELHEFAIITDAAELRAAVEPRDVLWIADEQFPVVSIGDLANSNIAELGHLVVKFNGLNEPELPGDVSVPAVPAPTVEAGTVIRITEGKR